MFEGEIDVLLTFQSVRKRGYAIQGFSLEKQRGYSGGAMNAAAARISKALKKLLHRELDILCYLAKQDWGYISTPVEGHRCAASIGMSELFVRAPLSDLLKTEFFKHADNFFGLEYRDFHHG